MKKFFTFIAAALFAGSMFAEAQVDLQYTGTTSVNMVGDGANNAALVGLDETMFTVLSDKGKASNHIGLNKAGDIRLYAHKDSGNGCTLTVNIAEGTILSIALDIKQSATFVVKAGENVVTEAGGSYAINASSFSIQNTTTGSTTQLQLNKITIVHDGEGGDVPVVYDTLTVAEAIAIADTLKDNAVSSVKYYVEGFAVNVADYSTVYNNQDFFMVADVNAPDSLLQAFRATPKKDGKAYAVLAGDEVRAFGKLKKFVKGGKTQLEIDQPSIEFIKETEGDHSISEPQIDTITVVRALAIGDSIGHGKTTAGQYVIEGYVTALTDNKGVANADGGWEQYKNQCMWVADTFDETAITKETAFFVYQGVASEQVTKGAKIRFTCAIKNYNGMIETAASKGAITILEKGGDPVVPPTQETMDTISVARALEIGAALEAGKTSDSIYVIAGYVSKIVTPYDSASQNETFWMVDEKGGRAATNAEGAFEVYRGKMDAVADLDAMVYVTAKIYKYQAMKNNQPNGDPVIETASSPIPAVHVEEAGTPEVIESITVARALAIGDSIGAGNVSSKRYEITGYVSYIQEEYSSFGNETFWITDTKGERTNDKTKAFEVYRGKPNTGKEIGIDAKIKIVCYIKNFSSTIENDGTNIPFEVLEQGTELTYDTITVKEALAEIAKLEDGATTFDKYVVKGYIAEVTGAYDPNFKNMNITMTDKFNRLEGDLTAFRAKIAEADVEKAVAGAYVYVFGTLQKHSNGPQIAQGGQITIVEAPKVDTVPITVAQAIEIASSLEKGEEADVFYAVTGYVAENIESGEGTQSFWMSDSETETEGDLYIDNVKIAAQAADHQQVCVYGWVGKDTEGDARILNGEAVIMSGEGIEQIVLTEKAQKVVVDGAIYIIRDNKLYNLQGAQVR